MTIDAAVVVVVLVVSVVAVLLLLVVMLLLVLLLLLLLWWCCPLLAERRSSSASTDRALRPVWITFQRYNFSVVAVFAVIYCKTIVNGQLSILKSHRNWPYQWSDQSFRPSNSEGILALGI